MFCFSALLEDVPKDYDSNATLKAKILYKSCINTCKLFSLSTRSLSVPVYTVLYLMITFHQCCFSRNQSIFLDLKKTPLDSDSDTCSKMVEHRTCLECFGKDLSSIKTQ